jgi:tetratricopeptide (TPR) repeat protein
MKYIQAAVLALTAALTLSAQTASPTPLKPKTGRERAALAAMLSAKDPDEQIAKAKELIAGFADTDFKGTAFFVMAVASDNKRDYDNVVVYGEQAIAADPLNFGTMALMAKAIALSTKEFDLDRAEKMARIEKLAKDSVEISKKAVKPNEKIPDDKFAAMVAENIEPAYEGLAFAAIVKKDYVACATNFQQASGMTGGVDPVLLARAANCYRMAKRYDEAIALFDKVLADPNSNEAVKQYVNQGKSQALQAKTAVK